MAELGQILVRPDGTEQILTGRGWIPNTPALEAASAAGVFGAATDSIVRSMSLGIIDPAGGEESELVSPIASRAGLGLDIALLGTGVAGGAKALATRGAREALSTTVARAGALADEAAGATVSGGGGLGRTSQGFIPRLSSQVPKPLERSVAAATSGVQTIPGLRIIGDWVTVANQRNLAAVTGRTMRMSSTDLKAGNGLLSPQTMEPVMARFDDVYQSARNLISEKATLPQVTALADDALEKALITERQHAAWTAADKELGDQMLDMRSQLRRVSRETVDTVRAAEAQEIIGDIQTTIKELSTNTQFTDELLQTDIDYKVWAAVRSPGVIGKEGMINPTSLKRSLGQRTSFGPNAVRGGARSSLPERVQNLLTALDELEAIGYQLPTSGTAERAVAGTFIASMLGFSAIN